MRHFNSVFWSWMVVAAFLAAVVSPAAMQAGRSIEGQAAICSSLGAFVAAERGGAPSLPALPHLFGHCPICALHGAFPALLTQPGYALALLPLAFAIPRPAAVASPSSHGWLCAQPRGPPLRD